MLMCEGDCDECDADIDAFAPATFARACGGYKPSGAMGGGGGGPKACGSVGQCIGSLLNTKP